MRALTAESGARRENETVLPQREVAYRSLFLRTPHAVLFAGQDGRIVHANPAACRLFEFSEEQLCEVGFDGVIDHCDPHQYDFFRQFANSGSFSGAMSFVAGSGSTFTGQVSTFLLDHPVMHLVIVREAGEHNRCGACARALADQLDLDVRDEAPDLQAAAIREMESFCHCISHDLRTPLRHINSYSTLLFEEFQTLLPAEGLAYLERIRVSTRMMGGMIDHLLQLSRVNRIEMVLEEVDLSVMAREVLLALKEKERRREVETVVCGAAAVLGDRAMLRTLMENLLDNAWKYTSQSSPARIEFGVTRLRGVEAFFVKDNGVGFDMAYSPKLFRTFERLHGPEFNGAGVGLAAAERIVRRHGGKIWGEGAVHQGATFYFTLPVYF